MAFNVKRVKDPAVSTQKYVDNVTNAGDHWLHGYQNPKRDPRAAAVAAAPRWQKAVTDVNALKRFTANAGAYNVDEAIATAVAVGKDHYVTGAVARRNKVLRKLTKIAAAQTTILQHADTMPTDTLANRLAKANYVATAMAALKGTFN